MNDDPILHIDVDYDVVEHGRKWAVCRSCGAQWADNDTDYELVTRGDNYCFEQLEKEVNR